MVKYQKYLKIIKKLLIVYLISVPVYYGFLSWTGIIEEYRKTEPRSAYLSDILHLSFGLEEGYYMMRHGEQDKTFYSRFYKNKLTEEKRKELFDITEFIIAFSSYREQFVIPFFPHWKKKTDTIGVVVRSVEPLHHTKILNQLIEVAERPCDHLPSRKEIDFELINKGNSIVRMDSDGKDTLPSAAILDERYQKARKEGKAKAPTDHEALVYSFKRAREVLQCDVSPKPKREKVRIDFLDLQKDKDGQFLRKDRKISIEVQRLD